MSQIIDKYCQLMISSVNNFTISYLADKIDFSHDYLNRWINHVKLTARHTRKRSTQQNTLIIDDTVLDKRYSKKIECSRYLWDNCEKKYSKELVW